MRKLLLVIPALILFSCTVNETCREKTFGDDVWVQDGGTFATGDIQFQEPDLITLLYNGDKRPCYFNTGCDVINLEVGGYDVWSIYQIDNNHIKLTANDSVFITYHR
jgi:hypothetical protein